MTLAAGTKLGPYEIQSPLGAGGMGEVYRAQDTRLKRTVAIKILPSHLCDNPEAKQREPNPESQVAKDVRETQKAQGDLADEAKELQKQVEKELGKDSAEAKQSQQTARLCGS